jgi:predicted transposase YbfD/YdcC
MEEKNINFLDYIGELKDPRIERRKLHKMSEILLLTLVATICGCEGWIDVEKFGKYQIDVLRKYLPYKNGIPSDDTLRRFFRRLDPEAFSKVFTNWVKAIIRSRSKNEDGKNQEIIAVDGKTIKRTFDHDDNNNQKALHLISAYATDLRLVLCQVKTEEKSNEITAIPKLLDVVDICGAIVTIDAMGCQKKIAQQIIDKKADYLLAVKGNQRALFDDINFFLK